MALGVSGSYTMIKANPNREFTSAKFSPSLESAVMQGSFTRYLQEEDSKHTVRLMVTTTGKKQEPHTSRICMWFEDSFLGSKLMLQLPNEALPETFELTVPASFLPDSQISIIAERYGGTERPFVLLPPYLSGAIIVKPETQLNALSVVFDASDSQRPTLRTSCTVF